MSLFGELAYRLAPHPENVASDALAYLLDTYPLARSALGLLVQELSPATSGSLTFRRESTGDDGSRPDFAVAQPDGLETALIEVKFWAGLTENQPVSYIRRLEHTAGAALIFIAPETGMTRLWFALLARLRDAAITIDLSPVAVTPYRAVTPTGQYICVTSWPAILDRMERALAGNAGAQEDTRQLRGLATIMEGAAFYPLISDDLSSQIARRQLQYVDILRDLCLRLDQDGFSGGGGITAALSGGLYVGKRLEISGNDFWIGIWYEPWRSLRETPYWLQVVDAAANRSRVTAALSSFRDASPPRILDLGSEIVIPLECKIVATRGELLASLHQQVAEVAALLAVAQGI